MPRPSETPRDRAYFRRLGDQRASTADRDAVIELLSRHCTDGRLTMDEFEERVAEATAARTGNELAEALHELPADGDGWTASDFATEEGSDERWYERTRAPETWGRRGWGGRPRPWFVLPLVVIGVVALAGGHVGFLFPAFWILFGIWFIHRRRWHHGMACGGRRGSHRHHDRRGDAPPWEGRRGAVPRRDERGDWAGSRTIDV